MSAPKKQKLKETEEEDEDNVGKWFLQFTSVGGLSQLGQSKFILSKIAWLLLLIFGVVVTIKNCVEIYQDYYKWEVRGVFLDFHALSIVYSRSNYFSMLGGDKGGASK